MATEDRYTSVGRLLDGPDDPSTEACVQHGNNVETCAECRVDFEREMRAFEAWRDSQPAPATVGELADIADLPF